MADLDPSRNPSPGARPPLAPLPPRGASPPAGGGYNSLPPGGVEPALMERPYVSAHGVIVLWLGIASAAVILIPHGWGWYLAPFIGAVAWYMGNQAMGKIYRGESDFRETWSSKRGRFVGAVMTILGGLYVLVHIFIWGVFTFVRRPLTPPPLSATAPGQFPPGFDQSGRPILPPGAVVTHQWSHTGPPNHGHAPKR